MPDLNHRARKILAAIVNEYLVTGDAVGSRTITRRPGIDLSAATIRNVMSDLEEAGLLKQPHTSAGRVPTDQGLRFFVDSLLKIRSISAKERDDLSQRYQLATDDLEGALKEAGRVLSELSTHTVVLVAPRPATDVLEHVEFIRLRDNELLAVLVARSGQVQNKLVTTPEVISGEDLERMHNYLNQSLGGLTLDEVRSKVAVELQNERLHYQELERRALELSQQVLPPEDLAGALIVEGHAHLLDGVGDGSDPAQIERMKALFRKLEQKRHLLELLERTAVADGIRVFIGAESKIDELADFTVVATPYGPADDGRPLGTLGVIGPTRMNYSKVITLVDFTAQLVSSVIGRR